MVADFPVREVAQTMGFAVRSSLTRRVLAASVGVAFVASLAVGSVAEAVPGRHGMVVPAVGVHPKAIRAGRSASGQFSCQGVPLDTDGTCYSPSQIQTAYGFDKLYRLGLNGRGRTIVIIDAYSNPYMATDLSIFDQTFGLPDPVFTQVAPDGLTPFDINDPEQVGWSGEIALDVEWAHAVAPGANITLVLARSSDDADILSATKYAVDNNLGDVISQSFGEAESCLDPQIRAQEHLVFQSATAKGITLVASSGDSGAAQPSCDGSSYVKSTSDPASDPLVTAVGGTNLQADLSGRYGSERAWSDQYSGCYPTDQQGCSGGGVSDVWGRPFYQARLGGTVGRSRGVPDVAYNAGVDGGVLTHWGVGNLVYGGAEGLTETDPVFWQFGGTSAGSPQWAGLAAIASQVARRRLGLINDQLYAIGLSPLGRYAFHDVTTGNNNYADISGYSAGRGWDPVTGLGSPRAEVLVPLLALGR